MNGGKQGLLLLDDDRYFQHIPSILAAIEQYGNTRLHKEGKDYHGACPFPDCTADTNGFMAWPELHWGFAHWHCRVCRRSGNLAHLVMAMEKVNFWEACRLLGIPENVPDIYIPPAKREEPVKDWQKIELVFLETVYPLAWRDLSKPRGRAYLAQRGIPLEVALQYGIGYLRAFDEISPEHLDKLQENIRAKLKEKHPDIASEKFSLRVGYLRRWFDSIVYPVAIDQRGNCGYACRTLRLWTPGMDEQKHKEMLTAYNDGREKDQIQRYLKTHRSGFFNGSTLATCNDVIFVEGVFDALSLLAAGLSNVVDIGGVPNFKETASRVLPRRIESATLAYDGDSAGVAAVETIFNHCRYKLGFTPRKCLIPDDDMGKDWNERYRKHGLAGLACLFDAMGMAPDGSLVASEPVVVYPIAREAPQETAPQEGEDVDDGAHCLACFRLLDEGNSDDWCITTDGTPFCSTCYTLRNIEHAEKAWPRLIEHGQPIDLGERIQQWRASAGCAACGSHEWVVDTLSGGLVCPCLINACAENTQRPASSPVVSHVIGDNCMTEEIQQAAALIVAEEGLPLPQALFRARLNARLEANGYPEYLAKSSVDQRARIIAYREKWFGPGNEVNDNV